MPATVTDTDLGYSRIVEVLGDLGRPRVEVGVRQNAPAYPPAPPGEDGEAPNREPLTVAAIAAVNEFGSRDGRIPARSFLRWTADTHRAAIVDKIRVAIREAMDGKRPIDKGLGRVGTFVVGLVRKRIRDLDDPRNADSTIKAKGADNPLINTGHLRRVIDWQVRRDGVVRDGGRP